MKFDLKSKKLFVRKNIFLLAILFFYILSRFVFIFKFPLFFDEAIYIRWAQKIILNWQWSKFISLMDGKQPFFIWLVSISHRVIAQPVIAGRIVSVLAGLGTIVTLYAISQKLFNKKTALLSTALYLFLPFFLIYDGLALMDASVLFFGVQAAYFSLLIAKELKLKQAVLLGLVIGLGLLTKSSANFFIMFLPLSFLFLEKKNKKNVFRYFFFLALAIALAKAIEAILRLSTYYEVIASKTHDFIKTFDEFFTRPFVGVKDNSLQISEWLLSYMGIGFFLLMIAAFLFKDKLKEKIFLFIQAVVPILAMLFFGKILYPRYFLFMLWPLIPLVASSIIQIRDKYQKLTVPLVIFLLLIFLNPLKNTYFLLTNPAQSSLPEKEAWQFFTGEPSGIGIQELRNFFDQQENQKNLIITDKSLGILPDGIAIFYFKNKNMTFKGSDGVNQELIEKYQKKYQPDNTYLILSWQGLEANIAAEKQLEIERQGERNVNWRVYQLIQ